MAREIRLQVTQPYHGPGGELLFEPGQQFPQDADLPEDLRIAPVIVEVEDKPAEAPAPAKAAKPAKGDAS